MSELQITGYEVLESLGQGGMASVWKAKQLSLDRIVAIKVLSPRMARDVSDIERFLTEAKSAAKLKHPGIIQVYDVNAEEGLYYIVMEYVAGYTVGDWLRRKGVLSEEDALLVVDCVADALDYAWTKEGIIHCDIKPDNIIIDADGTVKVADLGLARTITAMSTRKEDEYVMGTPAYMSPEQARGDADLDCRADIYSLGAMLYHLVTGKILFEGSSEDEIMEKHTSAAFVDDPIEDNPKLSKPLCWLVEKMLAKDKTVRQADWAGVRADIARVKKGRLPLGPPLPDGVSTVGRSKKRSAQEYSHTAQVRKQEAVSMSPAAKIFLPLLLIGIGAAVYYFVFKKPPAPPPQNVRKITVGPAQQVQPPPVQSAEKNAMDMFEFAKKWANDNKGRYAEAISRFEKVAADTKGTKYSLMAEDEIKLLARARQDAIEKVIAKLREDAQPLADKREFVKAAAVFEEYTGPMAHETASQRRAIAVELHDRQKLLEEEKRHSVSMMEQKMTDLVERAASELLTTGVLAAQQTVADAMTAGDMQPKEKELEEIRNLLDSAMALDNKILESFSVQKNQEVTVFLSTGAKTITITDVSGGKISGIQKLGVSASSPVSFDVDGLAPSEKLKRMGQDSLPEVALVKGMMAYSSKAYPHARKYFGSIQNALAPRLLAKVDGAEKKIVDDEAERALAANLRSLGYNVGPYDKEAWLKAVTDKVVPSNMQKKASEMVQKFRRDYANTQFIIDVEQILQALEDPNSVKTATPAENAAETGSSAPPPLPAELAMLKGNTEAVMNLFFRRNVRLTKEDVRVERGAGGQLVMVRIMSQLLEDISALAALPELKSLYCSAAGYDEQGNLKDIAALRYCQLEYLRIVNHKVSDISPIRKMTSLRILVLDNTNVRDISCLRGLQLESVSLVNTKVYDFGPLESMPLKRLNVSGTQFRNFEVLKKMPLEELALGDLGLSDLSCVSKLNLKALDITGARTRDFSALKGMDLVELTLANTRFSDMTILKGKNLRRLDISGTDVNDLSVIKDMEELRDLNINETKITDLGPIAGLPIRRLSCRGVKIRDYSVLREIPVEELNIDRVENPLKLIKELPRLREVNGTLIAELGETALLKLFRPLEGHKRR